MGDRGVIERLARRVSMGVEEGEGGVCEGGVEELKGLGKKR